MLLFFVTVPTSQFSKHNILPPESALWWKFMRNQINHVLIYRYGSILLQQEGTGKQHSNCLQVTWNDCYVYLWLILSVCTRGLINMPILHHYNNNVIRYQMMLQKKYCRIQNTWWKNTKTFCGNDMSNINLNDKKPFVETMTNKTPTETTTRVFKVVLVVGR